MGLRKSAFLWGEACGLYYSSKSRCVLSIGDEEGKCISSMTGGRFSLQERATWMGRCCGGVYRKRRDYHLQIWKNDSGLSSRTLSVSSPVYQRM